ncbi:MAG: acetyl-CoA carboxylase carboxyltransferase subunit beta [Flavobacteriales bacterium]|nr:acetyl-CoA carboxylase carboxyltransferase subunit beta [Flavobacteriales bacterium]
MSWYKRIKEGITTSTKDKKETPEGLWFKCPKCQTLTATEEFATNLWVCPKCEKHDRIGSEEYFNLIFNDGRYKELFSKIKSSDPLKFQDTKKYTDRLKAAKKKTGLEDAVRVAVGRIEDEDLVIAAMDFAFIGGSMGSAVGEKIARAVDHAVKYEIPLMIISKSGGARMMEASFSLMQLAKISAKLTLLAKAQVPYISFLTDPTTGGVTASYAMLGDVNIAEPGALIGFAGPRVVKETIGRDLPEGFQTSEFVQEHGFLDFIVKRSELREKLLTLIKLFNI